MKPRADRDTLTPLRERPDLGKRAEAAWPPVPDLFDVITYFRARGDSFALISRIGFGPVKIGKERCPQAA